MISFYNFFDLFLTLGTFLGVFLLLKRIFTFVIILYYFTQACSLYRSIKKNLRFLNTGKLSIEQKQAYCFNHFNMLFKKLLLMCQQDFFLHYATVDIQNYFWQRFAKEHPLFYIRGF